MKCLPSTLRRRDLKTQQSQPTEALECTRDMYTYICICIRNWPLPIGAFQDQCKQIVINKHNLVKNPNWREADQLAIYKRRREVELGATENNIS